MMAECFEEIQNKKLRELFQREAEFNFPEFLTLLRQTLRTTRKDFSEDTSISEFLLFKWEHGQFRGPIKMRHLVTISDYYNVPFRLMERKMDEYLSQLEVACK